MRSDRDQRTTEPRLAFPWRPQSGLTPLRDQEPRRLCGARRGFLSLLLAMKHEWQYYSAAAPYLLMATGTPSHPAKARRGFPLDGALLAFLFHAGSKDNAQL